LHVRAELRTDDLAISYLWQTDLISVQSAGLKISKKDLKTFLIRRKKMNSYKFVAAAIIVIAISLVSWKKCSEQGIAAPNWEPSLPIWDTQKGAEVKVTTKSKTSVVDNKTPVTETVTDVVVKCPPPLRIIVGKDKKNNKIGLDVEYPVNKWPLKDPVYKLKYERRAMDSVWVGVGIGTDNKASLGASVEF
jgi:hypothetical protein